MFSRIKISTSTESLSDSIARLKNELNNCDCVVIGAGAGLSASAGLEYNGKRFLDNFADFNKKYGIPDMYSGGFYPFGTLEEFWAWWSRHIYINRYCDAPNSTYKDLFELVKCKDYFVITTNVDHQFQKAGFDKNRLFYTQGDYGLFQCSEPCCQETYDNEEIIKAMYEQQRDMKIPTELIPKCPHCGKPVTVNLRCDETFVQDEGWYKANQRYNDFIGKCKDKRVLYLELGVGYNTPIIIKYPFWKYTSQNINATYVCINFGEAYTHDDIKSQSICIDADINIVLSKLNSKQ